MTPARPTAAFARAVLLAAVCVTGGVLLRRVDVVCLGVPFAAYAAWAFARRPELSPPSFAGGTARVAEGQSVTLAAAASPGTVCAAAWPPVPHVDFAPDLAAIVDVGGAAAAATPGRWGRYDVGPGVWAVSDSLGAFRRSGELDRVRINVVPATTQLAAGGPIARPVGVTGLHSSPARGTGSALADVRPFQPGDRLRRINWRVTSRTGVLHANSTFSDRDTDVLLVVDSLLDVGAVHDVSDETSLDITMRAMLAIARHHARLGDRVALHDLGSRLGSLRPGTGLRQVERLHELASATNRTVESRRSRRTPSFRSGAVAFVLSPLLDPLATDEVVRLLQAGAEVVVIDTLPGHLGAEVGVRSGDRRMWDETWAIRRLEREDSIAGLRGLGVPVVAWEGPESLTHVLRTMAEAQRAPRMRRGR